jgi:integrase
MKRRKWLWSTEESIHLFGPHAISPTTPSLAGILISKLPVNGLVFTTSVGTPIDPRNVKRRLDALLKDAGMPHFRVHDIRHFAASLMLAQGVPLKVVSDILGHSQISTTADLYTHVLPSLRKEAINLMDSILTGTK